MSDLDLERQSALIIVDVQKDFCPGGSLAVPEGDQIVPVINRLSPKFSLVAATKDWHPEDHVSFASNQEGREPFETIEMYGETQILWPDHCVKTTKGAEFHQDLDLTSVHCILHKGFRRELDSYSVFFENDKKTPTGLSFFLQGLGIKKVYLTGLAEDVCVYASAKDARRLDFETFVIRDAVRGVDTPEGSLEEAREDMKNRGVIYISSQELET